MEILTVFEEVGNTTGVQFIKSISEKSDIAGWGYFQTIVETNGRVDLGRSKLREFDEMFPVETVEIDLLNIPSEKKEELKRYGN